MKKIILTLAIAALAIGANLTSNAQIIRTLAGTDTLGHSGDGGPAWNAMVGTSWGMTMDHHGNIYVSDDYMNQIRKITPNGTITTIAGTGYPGYTGDGGPATSARLGYPSGLAVDRYNNLYFADNANFAVRKIDTNGTITTVAGDGSGRHGYSGDGGPAVNARFMGTVGVAFDNIGNLYITDGNTSIRKVDTFGIVRTIAGSTSWGYYGSEIAATAASLAGPCGIVIDNSNNIYFSDQSDNRIRKINSSGIITDFAGTGVSGSLGDGGDALHARISGPGGLAIDDSGNVYFADENNGKIRMVNTSGIISTVAGSGSWTYSGDGGPATAAGMKVPSSICLSPDGNLFITDRRNYVVREVVFNNTLTVAASAGNNICAGVPDTFTAPVGSNTYGLINQWMLNGSVTGAASPTFMSDSLNTGDVITYSLIDPRRHFNLDTSVSITMTVNPHVTPSISIASAVGDTICQGTTVLFTATPVNGGSTPTFQWQVNGVNTGTAITYSYAPATGDDIKAIMNTSAVCPTAHTVASSSIIMDVNRLVTPALSIAATSTNVCDGATATFTAVAANGGTMPTYQWKKFGVNVGTGNTYSYSPSNGDYISCDLVSNAICRTHDSAFSDVSMTVNPSVTPSVNIVSTPSERVDYAGELVTFYSEVTYGGSATTYQWYLNGVTIPGATASSYAMNVYTTDTVTCVVNSNAVCASNSSATSNTVVILSNSMAVDEVVKTNGNYTIMPNPNNGSFVLGGEVKGNVDDVNYEVYDMMGKTLLTGSIAPQNGIIHQQINLDNSMPTGQYLLRINNKNEEKTIHFTIAR